MSETTEKAVSLLEEKANQQEKQIKELLEKVEGGNKNNNVNNEQLVEQLKVLRQTLLTEREEIQKLLKEKDQKIEELKKVVDKKDYRINILKRYVKVETTN
ncbi:hypothetical protein ABK040_010422 [Willaertia magna]